MSNEVIFSLVQEEKAGEARPFFRQRITNFAPLTHSFIKSIIFFSVVMLIEFIFRSRFLFSKFYFLLTFYRNFYSL